MQKWFWCLVAAALAIVFIPGVARSRMGNDTAVQLLLLGIAVAFGYLVVLMLIARFFSHHTER